MDFYLDTLLHLPYVTVESCREVENTVVLKLKCLNETIECPHCGATLEHINQVEFVLIRDLPVFGKPVYLQVPRRQFHCLWCHKFPTERLEFVGWKHRYTGRYEHFIYEQVKRSSMEEVSRAEGLGVEAVKTIFEQQAVVAIKKTQGCPSV